MGGDGGVSPRARPAVQPFSPRPPYPTALDGPTVEVPRELPRFRSSHLIFVERYWDPDADRENAERRWNFVLDQMVRDYRSCIMEAEDAVTRR